MKNMAGEEGWPSSNPAEPYSKEESQNLKSIEFWTSVVMEIQENYVRVKVIPKVFSKK